MRTLIWPVLLVVLVTWWRASSDGSSRRHAPPEPGQPGTQTGSPRLDMLRDAYIAPDGNGGYYLTGTAGTFDRSGRPDYDHNRGVAMWHTTDLARWAPLGYVWDRVEHFRSVRRPKLGAWPDWGVPAGRIDGLLAQATTTPQLHRIKGHWYILCAMNDRNVLVQRSVSGRPQGPYRDHGYLVTRGQRPWLFVDDDERIYLLFGEGWIARVAPDLTKLAESPRLLRPETSSKPGGGRHTLGEAGLCLFRKGDTYYAFAPRWVAADGRGRCDAFLWKASSPYGPFKPTGVSIAGSGPVTVFRGPGGRWQAVTSRSFQAVPRIIPVRFSPNGGR